MQYEPAKRCCGGRLRRDLEAGDADLVGLVGAGLLLEDHGRVRAARDAGLTDANLKGEASRAVGKGVGEVGHGVIAIAPTADIELAGDVAELITGHGIEGVGYGDGFHFVVLFVDGLLF